MTQLAATPVGGAPVAVQPRWLPMNLLVYSGYLVNTMEQPMKNITMSTKKNLLTITIDLSQEFGLSSSGKTVIIASTEGNTSVGHESGAIIGLNVYKKPTTKA